ncbi:MAG TPA: hypothetical protein VGC65_00120 [Bacteroidia bacterium]|jgi:hypothetical protein
MRYIFEEEVRRIQKREVESLFTELSIREDAYVKEVENAGFDNIHDYEAAVSASLINRVVIIVILIAAVGTSLYLFL